MAETIFHALKLTVMIALASVFLFAINALVSLITALVFHNVIGEVLGIVSMCLPFNALVVFGAIGNVLTAILSFLIAKKIFDLTSWSVSAI